MSEEMCGESGCDTLRACQLRARRQRLRRDSESAEVARMKGRVSKAWTVWV